MLFQSIKKLGHSLLGHFFAMLVNSILGSVFCNTLLRDQNLINIASRSIKRSVLITEVQRNKARGNPTFGFLVIVTNGFLSPEITQKVNF